MIEYTASVDGITSEDLEGFLVGWPSPPSRERHLDLLRVDVVSDAALGRRDRSRL